jgi:hypothetical protein
VIADWATYKLVTGDRFSEEADVLGALARAQSRVEEITGRLFDKVERTESLPVDSEGLAWPSAYPVAAVTAPAGAAVSDDSLAIKTTTTSWVDAIAAVIPGLVADRPRVLVTYTGGYDGTTPPPTGLTDAICELASRYLEPADTRTMPAGATSLGSRGQNVSGGRLGGSSSIPPALMTEIKKFRHIKARLP